MSNLEFPPSSPSPEQMAVGKVVEDYLLFGKERDGDGNWVGADLYLDVSQVGRFFVNIVTKNQFTSEVLKSAYEDFLDPEILLDPIKESEKKPPFVLNDSVLSEEVLDRKIKGRVVEEDFAASLFWSPKE